MIKAVTCSRCRDVVEVPPRLEGQQCQCTVYCRCGSTYVQTNPGSVGYGGLGSPRTNEDHDP